MSTSQARVLDTFMQHLAKAVYNTQIHWSKICAVWFVTLLQIRPAPHKIAHHAHSHHFPHPLITGFKIMNPFLTTPANTFIPDRSCFPSLNNDFPSRRGTRGRRDVTHLACWASFCTCIGASGTGKGETHTKKRTGSGAGEFQSWCARHRGAM